MMYSVEVSATSANIGSGFDSLGLALSIHNRVMAEEYDRIEITAAPGASTGEDNLIYSTIKNLFDECAKPLSGLRLIEQPAIPSTRGLGSSLACIVSALLLANEMLGHPMTDDELLNKATEIEGHPDNVAPALLGGFVTGVYDENKLHYHRKPISEHLCFVAFVPPFKLSTEKARAVLPTSLPFADAVYNIGRSALATAAFCEGRYDLLEIATRDRVQQQYRLPLIRGGELMFELCPSWGARTVYISGAGPTIMAVVTKDHLKDFLQHAEKGIAEHKDISDYGIMRLSPCNDKPKVRRID